MEKELTDEEKVKALQRMMNYYCFKKLFKKGKLWESPQDI